MSLVQNKKSAAASTSEYIKDGKWVVKGQWAMGHLLVCIRTRVSFIRFPYLPPNHVRIDEI